MQRLEQMRDRAGRLISAAERIFGRPESVHAEPVRTDPEATGPS
jgi:hypothetical protein